MKPIYELSLKFNKYSFLSINIAYIGLRTLSVFLSAFPISLLLKNIISFTIVSPSVFVVISTGWITMIFGFWGSLLYLMRREY